MKSLSPLSVRMPTVLALLLVFAVVWLWHLGSTSLSAPQDNLEQLLWTHSLQWGYYKHPPLPTWLLWPFVQLAGWRVWVSYLGGATITLLALLVFWHLLAQLRGQRHAFVALLAVLCITYYNGRLYYYNHNTILMLAVCLSAWACWQAFETQRRVWWVVLGLAVGAGALSKYQIAVTIVCVLVFFVQQRAWRSAAQRQGLLIAGLLALLVFSPHVLWLQAHSFAPITYAMNSSLGLQLAPEQRSSQSLLWLADMLFNRALPAWFLLVAAAVCLGRQRPGAGSDELALPTKPAARAFLLIWGLVPLLLMLGLGLLTGAELQLQWGTAFLLFAVPAAMEAMPVLWQRVNLQRTLLAFVCIQAALLATSYATSFKGHASLRDKHWRSFDASVLAHRISPSVDELLGWPLRVVIGPSNVAAALAMQLPEKPLVLIDGRYDRSPWVTPDLVKRCGAIELVTGLSSALSDDVLPFGNDFPGWGWKIVPPVSFDQPC
jgi:4-amino-4-deoxy-L-arabinose transferase-like glycosyltransferase